MPLRNSYRECIQIHYQRDDSNYKNWALWLWEFPQGSGKEYHFTSRDEYGVVANIPLSTWSYLVKTNNLGLIIKAKGSWNYKDGPDRVIKFSKLKHDKFGIYHVYLKDDLIDVFDNEELEKTNVIQFARFKDFKIIEVLTSDEFKEFTIYKNGKYLKNYKLDETTKSVVYDLGFDKDISIDDVYEIEINFIKSKIINREPISNNRLYKSKKFTELYQYNGELGAIYTKKATTFKVWSPVSSSIILRLYNKGTPNYIVGKKGNDKPFREIPMVKDEHGVFSVTVHKNLEGKYYTYVVTNSSYTSREIIDPYAKSAGVNGIRGMIVNFERTNPEGFNKVKVHKIDPKHMTIYETHIADITSSKTWTNVKKYRKYEKTFLGASIPGTTYSENGKTVSTGFDHIKELGINAIQLQPIFDQANDEIHKTFNWGYNPLNFNVLEGSYSTNPYNGYSRIYEFKTFIKKCNEAGINVIMDVVYNHLNGAPGSSFDVLMPGYYFRYNEDGTLSNGSGCGNETASEMPMMRKFILDSTLFLAKEYKLGGFRFDLMGLHDLDTMAKLVENLRDFNENLVVYGEPWGGGCSALPFEESCNQANIPLYKGFGAFNDKIRDTLVHPAHNPESAGWISRVNTMPDTGETMQVVAAIKGTIFGQGEGFDDPNKTLNYVSCHDNYTISDRLRASNLKDESEIKKIAMMANAIIFTSNGMSLMLAGEEFMRNKKGVENSYNSPYEINALDYSLKIKNYDMFKNYQKLIKFKQTVYEAGLEKGLNTLLDVKTKGNLIYYTLKDKDTKRTYKIFHKNGYRNGGADIFDLSGYTVYLDTINAHKALGKSTQIVPYETLICYKVED